MYETPELDAETFTRSSAIRLYEADDFEGMRIAGPNPNQAIAFTDLKGL